MRAFAAALDAIPLALAENSGLSPIETLAELKSRQITEGTSVLGVDCMLTGNSDMRSAHVFDPYLVRCENSTCATAVG